MAAVSTMNHIDLTYGSDAETEKAYRQWVSGELFSMLGLQAEGEALIGRRRSRRAEESSASRSRT